VPLRAFVKFRILRLEVLHSAPRLNDQMPTGASIAGCLGTGKLFDHFFGELSATPPNAQPAYARLGLPPAVPSVITEGARLLFLTRDRGQRGQSKGYFSGPAWTANKYRRSSSLQCPSSGLQVDDHSYPRRAPGNDSRSRC
jgi:hypothetical protein